eukprot:TRINITY_DN373_c0_g1_i1.p1 TRINITY_DN373_c0_g1~~TRINITY_DN373_c0_g1_i1.p1  ORF type:complete len:288 (-),score=91.41 TRINITY_DN373_c0_g1_i1:206-1069(-)
MGAILERLGWLGTDPGETFFHFENIQKSKSKEVNTLVSSIENELTKLKRFNEFLQTTPDFNSFIDFTEETDKIFHVFIETCREIFDSINFLSESFEKLVDFGLNFFEVLNNDLSIILKIYCEILQFIYLLNISFLGKDDVIVNNFTLYRKRFPDSDMFRDVELIMSFSYNEAFFKIAFENITNSKHRENIFAFNKQFIEILSRYLIHDMGDSPSIYHLLQRDALVALLIGLHTQGVAVFKDSVVATERTLKAIDLFKDKATIHHHICVFCDGIEAIADPHIKALLID